MLRLPPTSLAVSQSDLHAHLQHLDFYSQLLTQGFKKHEIIRYLRENAANKEECPSKDLSLPETDCAPSTYGLATRLRGNLIASEHASLEHEIGELHNQQQFASPISPSPRDPVRQLDETPARATGIESYLPHREKKEHVPRQSSLLRFAQAMSSESSDGEGCKILSFPHRQSVTYRPRSETYSYDQSEIDESGPDMSCATPTDELISLSIDDRTADSVESKHTVKRIASSLRPDAEPFTPISIQASRSAESLKSQGPAVASTSDTASLSSSPPLITRSPDDTAPMSAPVTPAPGTPPTGRRITQNTADRSVTRHQFLDGTFTIYNDSVPARLQPQTPADLNQGRYLNEYSAAYTAPPGMIRSSATRQGFISDRQASGELSPVARAAIIRERRQREFVRGLRVEGLRIDRAHADPQQLNIRQTAGVNQLDLWRDDLDADGVGEENFEEPSVTALVQGMRTVSGNRRAF